MLPLICMKKGHPLKGADLLLADLTFNKETIQFFA